VNFFNMLSQFCGQGICPPGSAASAYTQAATTAASACTQAAGTGIAGVTNLFTMLCRMFGLGC
jgi:hypothetical protein